MSLVQQMVYYVPMMSHVTELERRLCRTTHDMISGLETSRRNWYRVFASNPAFIPLSHDWGGGVVFSLFRDLRRLSMYFFFIFILPLLVRHAWNGAAWAGLWTQTAMFCFCGKMCVDSPLWNHLTQLQNWGVPGLENRSKNHLRLLPIFMILTNSCGGEKG